MAYYVIHLVNKFEAEKEFHIYVNEIRFTRIDIR